jgi:hypothetical protein
MSLVMKLVHLRLCKSCVMFGIASLAILVGMKTDRIRTDITDIYLFIYLCLNSDSNTDSIKMADRIRLDIDIINM